MTTILSNRTPNHCRRRNRLRQRQLPFYSTMTKLSVLALTLFVKNTLLPTSNQKYFLFSQANASSSVKWTQNDNVAPEHQAAHNAPRSQKYWDEHGIKRPDYAKTDAEIAAERGGSAGIGGSIMWGMGIIFLLSGFIVAAVVWYGKVTGDWDTINNSVVGRIANKILDCFVTLGISGGHRLGSGAEGKKSISWLFGMKGGDNARESEEEARRLRLARFDEAMKAE